MRILFGKAGAVEENAATKEKLKGPGERCIWALGIWRLKSVFRSLQFSHLLPRVMPQLRVAFNTLGGGLG